MGFNYFEIDGAWLGGHPNYRWDRDGYTLDIDYRNRISNVIELKVKLLRSDYNTHSTYDDISYGGTSLALAERSREDEDAWGGELQADFHLFKGNTLTSGLSYNTGEWKYRGEDAAGIPTGDTTSKSRVMGFYLQDEHKFGELLTLTLGGRYDKYKFFDDRRYGKDYPDSEDEVFNPRAGIRANLTKKTSLYASAGKAYLPAPNTLKFRSGGRWLDNPRI